MNSLTTTTSEVTGIPRKRALSHPEEIAAMQQDEQPHYWCDRCRASTAVYMAKDHHWYPARVECFGCGWWLPLAEYEAITRGVLGLAS